MILCQSTNLEIYLQAAFSGESTAVITVLPNDELLTQDFGKFITYSIEHTNGKPKQQPNCLDKMMAAANELKGLTSIKDPRDNKQKLANEIVSTFTINGGKLTPASISQGDRLVQLLTTILWTVGRV